MAGLRCEIRDFRSEMAAYLARLAVCAARFDIGGVKSRSFGAGRSPDGNFVAEWGRRFPLAQRKRACAPRNGEERGRFLAAQAGAAWRTGGAAEERAKTR